MFKALKPFILPVLLFTLDRFLNEWTFEMNSFSSGVLIGLACFWFVMAILGNKALLRRVPGLLEWMPFLDPSGGFASEAQLTDKHISGKTFNLSLVTKSGEIRDRIFVDCDIYGPAVVKCSGTGLLTECSFMSKDAIITITQDRLIGPIHAIDCSFKRCRFVGVGFIGQKAEMEKYMNSVSN